MSEDCLARNSHEARYPALHVGVMPRECRANVARVSTPDCLPKSPGFLRMCECASVGSPFMYTAGLDAIFFGSLSTVEGGRSAASSHLHSVMACNGGGRCGTRPRVTRRI